MKPTLALYPPQLHGFLKVAATFGRASVGLENHNGEMPVLQIHEAGIALELEFLDHSALQEFSRQIQALVPTSAEALNG